MSEATLQGNEVCYGNKAHITEKWEDGKKGVGGVIQLNKYFSGQKN